MATDPEATPEEREDARLYTSIHRGTPGDVAFYLEACRGAAAVLELGCGAGRVALALAAAGLRVTGIDVHRGMLALAREEAARRNISDLFSCVAMDMRDFALEARFDRVIIPYNALFALPGAAAMADCLAAARRHLAPGGEVIFDVYAADAEDLEPPEEEPFEPLVTLLEGGQAVDVWTRERAAPPPWTLEVQYRFDVHDYPRTRRVRQRVRHCAVPWDALPGLCARAGLAVVACYGDFAGAPFDAAASERVVLRGTPG